MVKASLQEVKYICQFHLIYADPVNENSHIYIFMKSNKNEGKSIITYIHSGHLHCILSTLPCLLS